MYSVEVRICWSVSNEISVMGLGVCDVELGGQVLQMKWKIFNGILECDDFYCYDNCIVFVVV